jgi:hypothetical protein
MNEAADKFSQTLADIRSGVEDAFANGRPRIGLHTSDATPPEPEPAAEPEAYPQPQAQTTPEEEPPIPTTMLEWIYLLHGQLAYLDAQMLRIERFLGMGERPTAR